MTDETTPDASSRRMGAIRKQHTEPELQVRRRLHSLGFRFRLHRRELPGTPDIVLPRHRAVIFVHGCFWHRHEGCRLATMPKSNEAFWQAKFDANLARDLRNQRDLSELGWSSHVIWECETRDSGLLRDRLILLFSSGSNSNEAVDLRRCD
jgi:DNA mismatch endonuclease (patch repair protein)